MKRIFVGALGLFLATTVSFSTAHELDHPASELSTTQPLSTEVNAGGPNAQWDLLSTIATGNPHTDLDFFTQNGEIYAAVGTLAIGPNGGGQTIVKLTTDGAVDPTLVSSHQSAACISNPAAALGLQHDVEATPKGKALLTRGGFADRRDAQLLIDATDASGRCHDQGTGGLVSAPSGGLEIIDITNIEDPVEIGLTSHIGEAHTVNVDPKRPHIAYAVTSDGVTLDRKGTDDPSDDVRENEYETDSDRFDLDGFEVVDLSSCLDLPRTMSVDDKRERCRPQVFRYRYPTIEMAVGHTSRNSIYGCHELEIYPNDRLTCGSGQALIVLDMSGAFDDNGTPRDFSDDKPRGTPLPCKVRASSSLGPFATGAMVTDCEAGERNGEPVDLTVAGWLKDGAPSLEGVRHVGTVFHMGRGASEDGVQTAYGPEDDIDFNHEAELSRTGRFLLATDERGGGVVPPGAACSPQVDNPEGNGGIHAYSVDRLLKESPGTAREAWRSYARTPSGAKAIWRAPVRTTPEPTICTAHVFQQIPGQNRIFMGWYSQGTQVVDYVERRDGTFEFRQAGWFIPEYANTWVSHIFKMQRNDDGSFTYWGATGDFNIGAAGRNAIDVYSVTLPAPPNLAGTPVNRQGAGGGKAGGGGKGSGKGKADDGTQVLGSVVHRSSTSSGSGLAATGGDLTGWLVLGIALMVLGMTLARRRRQEVSRGRPYPLM